MIKQRICSFFKRNDTNGYESTKPLNQLEYEVELAGHCNLNCWGCNHFSPLINSEFLDTYEYKKDCERLGELFHNKAKLIKLLGGEPLLNSDINKIINITRQNFPKAQIEIITNGTLIKSMKKDFWNCCRKNKVSINITKYPVSLDYKEIEMTIKKNKIKFHYGNPDGNIIKNQSKFTLDENGGQNISENFKMCHEANNCHTLRHGRLYTCSIAPYIERFNLKFNKNLKLQEEDGINIYQALSSKEILEFLARPISFCKYCDVNRREHNQFPWKISEKNIYEWLANADDK